MDHRTIRSTALKQQRQQQNNNSNNKTTATLHRTEDTQSNQSRFCTLFTFNWIKAWNTSLGEHSYTTSAGTRNRRQVQRTTHSYVDSIQPITILSDTANFRKASSPRRSIIHRNSWPFPTMFVSIIFFKVLCTFWYIFLIFFFSFLGVFFVLNALTELFQSGSFWCVLQMTFIHASERWFTHLLIQVFNVHRNHKAY